MSAVANKLQLHGKPTITGETLFINTIKDPEMMKIFNDRCGCSSISLLPFRMNVEQKGNGVSGVLVGLRRVLLQEAPGYVLTAPDNWTPPKNADAQMVPQVLRMALACVAVRPDLDTDEASKMRMRMNVHNAGRVNGEVYISQIEFVSERPSDPPFLGTCQIAMCAVGSTCYIPDITIERIPASENVLASPVGRSVVTPIYDGYDAEHGAKHDAKHDAEMPNPDMYPNAYGATVAHGMNGCGDRWVTEAGLDPVGANLLLEFKVLPVGGGMLTAKNLLRDAAVLLDADVKMFFDVAKNEQIHHSRDGDEEFVKMQINIDNMFCTIGYVVDDSLGDALTPFAEHLSFDSNKMRGLHMTIIVGVYPDGIDGLDNAPRTHDQAENMLRDALSVSEKHIAKIISQFI